MTPETKKRNLTRLDIPTLVSLSHKAMAEEDPASAVTYLRTAVRRAPLRQDLRLLLYQAIEQSVGSAEHEAAQEALGGSGRGASGKGGVSGESGGKNGELWSRAVVEGEDEESPLALATRPAGPPARGMRAGAGRHHTSPGSRPLGLIIGSIALTIAAVGLGLSFLMGPAETPKEAAAEQAEAIIAEQDAALLQMAREYEDQNLFDEAIEKLILLNDGPQKQTLLSKAYARRGDRFTRAGRYNSAERSYQTALSYQPDDAGLSYDLGVTYYTLGRQRQVSDRQAASEYFARADRQLEETGKLDPENSKILDARARVEIARGNSAAAAEYLRRIVKLDPESKDAKKAVRTMKQMGFKP